MKQMTDNAGPEIFIEVLEAEIRSVINDDNTEFIRQYCGLIPEVMTRAHHRVRKLSARQMIRLYGELAFELALCEEEHGNYRDRDVATICVKLRLQRKLDRMFNLPKHIAPTTTASASPAKPKIRKPKAPKRAVA